MPIWCFRFGTENIKYPEYGKPCVFVYLLAKQRSNIHGRSLDGGGVRVRREYARIFKEALILMISKVMSVELTFH